MRHALTRVRALLPDTQQVLTEGPFCQHPRVLAANPSAKHRARRAGGGRSALPRGASEDLPGESLGRSQGSLSGRQGMEEGESGVGRSGKVGERGGWRSWAGGYLSI